MDALPPTSAKLLGTTGTAVPLSPQLLFQVSKPRLDPDALAGGVEQRLGRDLAGDPIAEDVDLHRTARLGVARRHVGVRNRTLDGEAVAAARNSPGDVAVD